MTPIEHPPPQHQSQEPGREDRMTPSPEYRPRHPGADKLKGRVALITGGDSGIGRAVALAFAREGADLAFVYLEEESDAAETCALVEAEGRAVMKLRGDVGDEEFCRHAVSQVRSEEHTSELQSLMRISYAVFCLTKKKNISTDLYKRNSTDTPH